MTAVARTAIAERTPRICRMPACSLAFWPRKRTSDLASTRAELSLPFAAAALISFTSFASSRSTDSSSRSKSVCAHAPYSPRRQTRQIG